MAITAAELVERVRTGINEPAANAEPQRTDKQILQWLSDAQHDYVAKIPADSVPDLIKETAASTGSSIPYPEDYLKAFQVLVEHTISVSVTKVDPATMLEVDEQYLALNYPGVLGAWALFREGGIQVGPDAVSSVLVYQRCPTPLVDLCDEFELGCGHDVPVVDRAIALALLKINDEGSPSSLELYGERVQAEGSKFGQKVEVEKVP